MRQHQSLRAMLGFVQQQHVDVDFPRPVAHAFASAPQLFLNRLAGVQQLLRPERSLDSQAGVEKVTLIRDESHRLEAVTRRQGRFPGDGRERPAGR